MNNSLSSWSQQPGNGAQPLVHGDKPLAAVIAWGDIAVTDPQIDVVELCYEYSRAVRDNSCGQCVPCRIGTQIIADLFEGLRDGRGKIEDLEQIRELATAISQTSLCDIGKTGPLAFIHMLEHNREDFLRAVQGGAAKKGPYSYRSFVTAPCIEACPIHLDIPRYIEEIRLGNFKESLEVITSRLPLPGVVGRVCVRPCEHVCKRGKADEALQIKHLKRFVADVALQAAPAVTPAVVDAAKTRKVAIVGAGPAGLTCAHFLALKGYKVTIFEILSEPGGMAAVGIPDYRLPREILTGEVEAIKKLGVEILYNKCLGIDFTLEQLEALGYSAVFIGMGCHCHKRLGIEGEQKGYYGYVPGILFLRNINLGHLDEVPKGKKIVVVGGGNVAIDCVRTSFRLGFEEAHVVYRRSRKEMPADEVEIRDAEDEGVQFHFQIAPKKILGENGRVTGLECVKMELGEPDASGRRRPVEIPGSEFIIDADVVVAAVGQDGDFSCMCNLPGVSVDDRGVIIVDENLMSSRRGVFAGGDCILGPDTVIRACAHGRLIGLKIAGYLQQNIIEQLAEEHDEVLLQQLHAISSMDKDVLLPREKRIPVHHEPPQVRKTDFREVEKGFTPQEAMAEAGRCMRCYKVVTCAFRDEVAAG